MNSTISLLLRALGSLKLSVVLVVLLALLTWLGTMAQVEHGLFVAQRDYFESWYVWAEMPLAFWGTPLGKIYLPLPGGYLVMLVLFLNLVVGGIGRLRLRRATVGVLITHLGVGMLLIAGFVKMTASTSGRLALYEARTDMAMGDRVTQDASYVSFHDYELALLQDGGDTITERVVPEAVLVAAAKATVTLRPEGLPFAIEVHHWLDNCRPLPKPPMIDALPTPVVDGVFLQPQDVQAERTDNMAGCYVTVVEPGGPRHEGIVVGDEWRPLTRYRTPFTFTVQGVRYGLDLRRVTSDLPFAMRLDEFRKSDHPGTANARDFRSFVTVIDGEGAAAREQKAQIYMNQPLRRDGYVLYQTSWGPPDNSGPPFYSVFEVARNPSDQWPFYAALVIALGLLVHFGTKIFSFLNSSTREALSS
ncbi:MAG: cytochrome c biogenesis protein ResB [Planctomycetota bacterium]